MRRQNRCIPRKPAHTVFYLIDTNFLVYRLFDASRITNATEKHRTEVAQTYWQEIDAQRKVGKAKVFVLDVCIAEAFKTLAKKYYNGSGIFPKPAYLNQAREKLRGEVHLTARDAAKANRNISFHDIQTSRDIILGVDRFFERVFKQNRKVGIIDLMILSTARFLIDFLGFERDRLFIITMDGPLYELAKTYTDLPAAFNPDKSADAPSKVFSDSLH